MKKVVLVFPDATCLVEFVLVYRPSGTEVNSENLQLTAVLSEQLIQVAIIKYGAKQVKPDARQQS